MKRWIFTILLFLLLGALVNVAVAWGFALLGAGALSTEWEEMDMEVLERDELGGPAKVWEVRIGDGLGHAVVWVGWWYGWDPGAEADTVIPTRKNVAAYLPRWSDLSDPVFRVRGKAFPPLSELRAPPMRTNIAYGWPVVALWHGHQWIVADIGGTLYQSDVWGGFDLGPPPQDPTGFPRVLPYRPIWLGMLINTLFYAILLYLAIAGSGALRRLIRLKRGRCPRCGYDLRGALQAGCPECGWNRQPEATT